MQDIKIKSQKTGQIYKFKTERDISDPAVLEEVLGNARALAGQLDEAFIARTSSSTPSGPKPTQPFEPQQPAPEYEDIQSTSGSEYGDITSTPEPKQSMLASAIDAIKSAPSNAMRQFNSISTSYSDTASDKKADGVLDAVGSSLADTLRIQQGMARGDVNSILREENAIGSRRDEMSEAIENAGLKLASGETIPEWMKYAILGGTTLGSVAVGSIPTMFEGGTMALGGAGARLGLLKAMKKGGKGAAFLKKNLPHDYNVLNEIAKRDALRAEYPMKIGADILESARKKPAPTAPDGSGTTQSPSFPENAGAPVKQSVGAEPSAETKAAIQPKTRRWAGKINREMQLEFDDLKTQSLGADYLYVDDQLYSGGMKNNWTKTTKSGPFKVGDMFTKEFAEKVEPEYGRMPSWESSRLFDGKIIRMFEDKNQNAVKLTVKNKDGWTNDIVVGLTEKEGPATIDQRISEALEAYLYWGNRLKQLEDVDAGGGYPYRFAEKMFKKAEGEHERLLELKKKQIK